jgi:hypothetical protein
VHPKDAGSESDRRSARAVLRVFSDVYVTLGQGQSLLDSCPPQEHVQAWGLLAAAPEFPPTELGNASNSKLLHIYLHIGEMNVLKTAP